MRKCEDVCVKQKPNVKHPVFLSVQLAVCWRQITDQKLSLYLENQAGTPDMWEKSKQFYADNTCIDPEHLNTG